MLAQNRDVVQARFTDLAGKWRERTKGTGLTGGGREVVFSYMDAERWKDWMKSMYGIQALTGQYENLDAVSVVITDHKVRFRLLAFGRLGCAH